MPTRSRRLAAFLLVGLPLVVALIPLALPPFTMSLVTVRIAAAALGPVVALVAILAGLVAVALTRGAARLSSVALSVVAACLALLPSLAAWKVAGPPVALDPFGTLRGLPTPPRVEAHTVRYSAEDGTALELRRYRDPARCPVACPTVAVVYAGAWTNGSSAQSARTDRWLAGHGYTVVALDYRHAPAHPYPAAPHDIRLGLTLLRDSAAAWGVDPRNVVLWGRSSGGHLATLTAWDPTPQAVTVRGVISYYGPYDLARGYVDRPSPDPIDARRVLGNFLSGTPTTVPDRYRDASPKTYVRPGLPPTLLVYGGGDHLVKPEFGRAAAAALRAAGDSVTFVEIPFAEHAFDLADGSWQSASALGAVLRFLAHVVPTTRL